ncbi:BppU family phage baseplate upper protein [Bacillus inaquosorum]|uniref:BppU family phage baseplate upper protein n=1 Tax=Bacillus inaquosorum TaxID=483913 RepID=UPI0022813609|nr:BppU family phage baseplate upper protein [Bacillus inaquosorum]MCY9060990.1 BppU family phage baseplate upper protein [Bacillus inaquosorum]
MVYKDANVSASITTNLGDYKTTNIRFSTQDVGTAKLSFYLFKDGVPLPLSAVTGRLVMVMADGSRFIKDVTIVDKLAGQAEYVLTREEIKHYGKVTAALNLYYNNGQSLAVVRFTFEITQDLIDSNIAPSAEYYIEQFEDLKEEVEAIVADLQVKFADLDNVETKTGAQAKADAVQANLDTHAGNKANPHQVTKAQVGLGNVTNDKQATKTEFDLHANDEVKHITNTERLNWNASQGKVDSHVARTDNPHGVTKVQVGLDKVDNVQQASKTAFDTHNADSVRHVVQADKDKWNGAQLSKITADHGGVSIAANEGEDILQKIVDQGRTMGTFYANGKAVNAPSSYSTRGIFHLTGLSSEGKGMYGWVYATDYKNNIFTNYYDGSTTYWQGWKKLITDVSYESLIWQNVTLKNGAATNERAFQYAKWGNLLLLRGHITATREVVCGTIPSDRMPPNGAVAMVPVSGTTGYSKLLIYANGDMKLTGIHSNNDAGVTGYYMDAVIPLA